MDRKSQDSFMASVIRSPPSSPEGTLQKKKLKLSHTDGRKSPPNLNKDVTSFERRAKENDDHINNSLKQKGNQSVKAEMLFDFLQIFSCFCYSIVKNI